MANGTGQHYEAVPPIQHLSKLVESMRSDLHQINSRINLLERSLADVRNQQLRKKVNIHIEISVLNFNTKSSMNKSKILELKYPKWWPFTEISPAWFAFMIVWPFVAQRIMVAIQRKKWSSFAYIPDHRRREAANIWIEQLEKQNMF